MSLQEVTAQITGEHARAGIDYTVKVDLPDTLGQAVEMYGEDLVYNRLMSSLTIDCQSAIRTQIKKDNATIESIQAYFTELDDGKGWRPKLKARGKSVPEKIQSMLSSLTDEERAAVLAEYM